MSEGIGDRELVVFCGYRDWANSCGAWARAIRDHSEHLFARCIVRDAHPFGYEQDVVLGEAFGGVGEPKGWASEEELRDLLVNADWLVHGGDSDYDSWKFFERFAGRPLRREKRTGVWHCGDSYRRHPRRFNFVDRRVQRYDRRFLSYDLVRFARKDPTALATPHNAFDPDELRAVPKAERVTVSHSPSKRDNKGTHLFLEATDELRRRGLDFEVDLIEGVPNDECLRRKARSHVFFDQIHPVGGIGTSTAEAAAAGACVLAAYHNIPDWVQERTGGPWPIVPVSDRATLVRALERLLTDHELRERTAAETYDWFLRLFSRESVAAFFDRALARETALA